MDLDLSQYRVSSGKGFDLTSFRTAPSKKNRLGKIESAEILAENVAEIRALQSKLYAEGKTGLLVLFQGIDGAGKDSAIRNVIGVNPQGVFVQSFKQPSKTELAHDYLWRYAKCVPERGMIGIFNRSYYEDVLVVKVHQLYKDLNIASKHKGPGTITKRYKHIRNFEEYLTENGIVIVKVYLNLSKDEQRERFLKRIDREDKNWKFSDTDLRERGYWDSYQDAFQKAIKSTSTEYAPWWVVPADHKPYTRLVVSEIILDALRTIKPKYPPVTKEHKQVLAESRLVLMAEDE